MLKGKELGRAIAKAIELKIASGAIATKTEVARHFGIKTPSIYGWIKRGAISKDKLPELWNYFSDVVGSEHWGLDKYPTTRHDSNIEPATGLRGRVPLISWVQAGEFNYVNDQFPPGHTEEFVDTTVNVGRHTFALRVKGDSMEPNFPEGAILIIEPDMDFQPGDYVIAKNGDNEATFKQLVKDGADWYLKPLNPRYPIKPLGTSTIIGIAREVIQKLR
jgi:SOS-response transcriptional repressor LexA